MQSPINRREILKTSATVAAAGAVSTLGSALGPIAAAIEPIVRNGSPKFKFSLAGYSYRNLLLGDSAELTFDDFIEDCAKMNLDGTELTSYYFPTSPTADYFRKLRQHCFRLGLDISGTAIRNDFSHPAGPEREKEIASTKQWIDHAEILGAPVIRIFAGHQKKDQTAKEMHALMVTGIEECCDYAGQHGVHLALENHGGPTATVESMLSIVRDVRSPWFGVNLDSGNFHTDDPYAELAQIAPYALNVQVKVDTTDEKRKNKKPTDYARLAKILRGANYRGYIVLEYEEEGDPRVECPKYMEQLREAFS